MEWGGINNHQRTPFYRLDGNLAGIRGRDGILRPLVIPALWAIGPNELLMDDNSPCHRPRVTNNFTQAKKMSQGGSVPPSYPIWTQSNMSGLFWEDVSGRTTRRQPTVTPSSSSCSRTTTDTPDRSQKAP